MIRTEREYRPFTTQDETAFTETIRTQEESSYYFQAPTNTLYLTEATDGIHELSLLNRGISGTAYPTMEEAAKIYGTALSRMEAYDYSQVLNAGFRVADGNSKILIRYEEIAAVHSSKYVPMPIPDLFQITKDELEQKFGEVEFRSGYNSTSYTECFFDLVEQEDELNEKYQKATEGFHKNYGFSFMPVIRFASSDTAIAQASLTPLLAVGNRYIRFVPSIKTKHDRSGRSYGTAAFQESVKQCFAKFDDTVETVERLGKITLRHPANAVIGLCKRYHIPKSHAEQVWEDIKRFEEASVEVSAYDLYVALSLQVANSKENLSRYTALTLEENLAKALTGDFKSLDSAITPKW